MKIIPGSEIELKIETGNAFGSGETKATFNLYERYDGSLEIISEEGKKLHIEIAENRRMVSIKQE